MQPYLVLWHMLATQKHECKRPLTIGSDASLLRLQVYSGPEVADMAGHLMVYPYHISETGAVTYLGSEFLPDTKTAKVTGQQGSAGYRPELVCSLKAWCQHTQAAAQRGPLTSVCTSAGARAKVCSTAMPADHMSC
jgi:Phospholipase D C terminal